MLLSEDGMKERAEDAYEIDLLRIAKVLWSKLWIIIVAGILAGVAAFSYAKFAITPLYQATTMIYVNNSSISLGNSKISVSASELSAAQSLVETYIVILKTRMTLNDVIAKSGVDYSYGQLNEMISASAVNETEIFKVTVTSPDPSEAALIANTIGSVLPEKISNILEGSSPRIVDRAVVPSSKVSPNEARYAAIGLLIGAVLAAAAIVLFDMFDDVIKDEDYLIQTYNVPVLSSIPNLNSDSSGSYGKRYGYYGRKGYGYGKSYGYGYGYGKSSKKNDKNNPYYYKKH